MSDAQRAQDVFTQAAGTAVETLALWAEVNQRVLRDLVGLGSGTLAEGVRLYTDLQRTALDAVRESQAEWAGSLAGARRAVRLAEANAQAVSRTAERVQAAAEAASKGIQETCASAAARMKELYARA